MKNVKILIQVVIVKNGANDKSLQGYFHLHFN